MATSTRDDWPVAKKRQVRERLRAAVDSDRTVVVHYACAEPGGAVTAIGVRNLATGQTRSTGYTSPPSFTTNEHGEWVPGAALNPRHEAEMLREFFAYMDSLGTVDVIHWNMRDTRFGFGHLLVRHRLYGGDGSLPPESKRLDLSAMLWDIHGDFAPHPRWRSLAVINGLSTKDALTGAEEAADPVGAYASMLRKLQWTCDLAKLEAAGKLKTQNSVWRWIRANPWTSAWIGLGIAGSIASLIALL